MTNKLNWHFGPSASEEHGPNDSITTTFKGDKYYSLAREVLQNSIDAIDDPNKPVIVSFSCFDLEIGELETFWDLKPTLEACQAYYSNETKFVVFCKKAKEKLGNGKIKCLRISDFNTGGMEYSEGTESKFYGFMKSVGVTNKSGSGSGGSFGFGKGAYYAASLIRTIMVSSIFGDGDHIFQGKARVTTHRDINGNLRDYTGLFGLEKGKPVVEEDIIPTIFKREEKGTDIFIMGFDDENNWIESLVKSILNNFWLAIWDEKLIVDVEGTVINKESLERVIQRFYNENTPDGSINEAETWNPYPYFKAVKFFRDENTEVFEDYLTILGKVKLYLYLKDGLPNRIVYMRSPKMVVFKRTLKRGLDYAGVFVCDNPKGNELLRQMENPQHNEWKKNNYLENDKPHPDAKKAEDELKDFVRRCLESLMDTESTKSKSIFGLDEYLSIPEDLIPEKRGGGDAVGGGDSSEEKTENETPVEITENKIQPVISLKVQNKAQATNQIEGENDPEGDIPILTGSEHKKDDPPEPPPSPGDIPGLNPALGTDSGNNKIRTILNLKCRTVAQRNSNNEIEHILLIFADNDVENAEIDLFAGVDNDSETDDGMLNIISATKDNQVLTAKGNSISKIPLKKGKNLLAIKFDSNQKHSLKIKSYEI